MRDRRAIEADVALLSQAVDLYSAFAGTIPPFNAALTAAKQAPLPIIGTVRDERQ